MVFTTSLDITFGILVATLITFVIYWKRFRANHYWRKRGVPGQDPLPLLGNMLPILRGKTFHEVDLEWYNKYGRLYGSYMGHKPTLYVAEPELLKRILVKDFHVFVDRRTLKTSNEILNSFITALPGDEWKRVRSVITPAFSSGKLKKMYKLMMECGETTVANYLKCADSGEPVDCKKIFGGYTLDVIASAAFGTKLNSHEDPDNIFIQNAKKLFTVAFSWKLVLFFVAPKLANKLNLIPFDIDVMDFFIELTSSIVERRKRTNEVRDDFLNALLEAQKNSKGPAETGESKLVNEHRPTDKVDNKDDEDESHSYFKDYSKNKTISNNEFVAQCILFFLAGYDTTATTLSMVVYYLALNPELQDKVVKEVDQIWKKHDTITSEALNEMKYTDAVISETLRLAPPAGRLERTTLEDYPLGDTGITIPKGMIVAIPAYAMHLDPDFFPNPTKFDPERFLPENKDQIQNYTYLPFGAGPRNCLGMRFALSEIKLALLRIYKDVTFHVCPETAIPMEVIRGTGLYQPKAVMLKITKRK